MSAIPAVRLYVIGNDSEERVREHSGFLPLVLQLGERLNLNLREPELYEGRLIAIHEAPLGPQASPREGGPGAASSPDAPTAIEDCRRAIRWGWLLRQEDATIIQDLIGLASIRMGAEQLYMLAARRGDQPLMLAAAIVQGEATPQRLRTAQFKTRLSAYAEGKNAVTDRKVDDLIGVAKSSPDRRFRNEAIVMLGFARFMGTSAQAKKSENTLAELKASPDAFVAGNAQWALELRRGDLWRFSNGNI